MRIGIIGVGGMGSFHARTLAALPGVEVSFVTDPSDERTRVLRAELGVGVDPDPMTLLSRRDLDGVVIASPDDTHAEYATAALAAGLAVLCEKPLATSVADAQSVVDAEIALGRRQVQLGFMREYDPAHVQVIEAVRRAGPIDHIHALHRNANDQPRPLDEIVGQSIVHDVHTVRFVSGADIESVTASGSGATSDRNGEPTFRHVLATCRLSTGAHALLEFDDCGFGYEVGVEVLTGDGDVVAGHPARVSRRRAGSILHEVGVDWFGRFADAYRHQDAAWVGSIEGGTASGPTAWDGLVAQRAIDAILQSLRTGERVDVANAERPDFYG